MTASESSQSLAVLIPLKRVADAKQRLRDGGVRDVDALVLHLARGVIEASSPRPVVVVTEDDDVAVFASSLGAAIVRTNATTLSDAVHDAYTTLASRYQRLVIVHADLAAPEGIGDFVPVEGITMVADHHGEGTTVLSLDTGLDFHFAYGAHSLARHIEEARRLHVNYSVITESTWSRDVDEPGDVNPSMWP
jgi:2-phospho-L-lactate/phosphoenolpyruvate guanylyltransferase